MNNLAFFDGLSLWWHAHDAAGQIFIGIGAVAGVVTLILLALTMMGLDHGGIADTLEIDVASDADVQADGSLFSTRSITGFFLGFGGIGAIVHERTHDTLLASFAGSVSGVLLLYVIYVIGKSLLRLQSDGTVDFKQAVGSIGTVYITVPPGRGSGGQAQIVFQNHHEVVNVISDSAAALPAGANIRVKEYISQNLFLVEAL
ncbi:MAG: hypothetical protein LBV54_01345 [Puniceicoccales bacterium]|jgi:prepilin signal peptidase PulO-like enzyme (type II secretory pathway)|nr:hypothetical protein [Puniceicoccales bacterium]